MPMRGYLRIYNKLTFEAQFYLTEKNPKGGNESVTGTMIVALWLRHIVYGSLV